MCVGIHRLGQRGFEQSLGLTFAQDSLVGRQAQLEAEPLEHLTADTVDGAQAGLADGCGQVDTSLFKKPGAGAFAQLGSGLHREGRGQDGVRACCAGLEGSGERFGQLVGLATAGACADELDVVHYCQPPSKTRWSRSHLLGPLTGRVPSGPWNSSVAPSGTTSMVPASSCCLRQFQVARALSSRVVTVTPSGGLLTCAFGKVSAVVTYSAPLSRMK
ncbi:hypothetical protein D3C84_819920 [compost metagenome]